jgi:pimeloyl-ACP methyl ester carboxylesterase
MPAPQKPIVHWMGGWVSSLDCWEPQLRAAFPEFEHRFIDTHAVLENAWPPSLTPEGRTHIVAAWSLGSLRVHRWMAEGTWPKDVPVLSLCPVFRFVQPGAFGESVLVRMEQKLGAEREAVLRDFWKRIPKAADMPPEWEEAWIAGTRRYDDASVLRALRYLRLKVADAENLLSAPDRWELVTGDADRLTPLASLHAVRENLPPQARLHVYSGGHIPFWECPERVRESLHRLAYGIPRTPQEKLKEEN